MLIADKKLINTCTNFFRRNINEHFGRIIFGSQIAFDEVNMDCPEYYRAGDKMSECRAKILKQHLDLEQLRETTL